MAMRTQSLLTAAAIVMTMPLAACATGVSGEAYGASGYSSATVEASYGGGYAEKHATGYLPAHNAGLGDDGLLPEPPANAKAGQCFAKVVVPGQRVYGPPSGPHLKWVQSPPPPGAIGPVWCQVWDQGYEPTVLTTPERYGWIRVICDKDATGEKISHIQHRLHDWGYYHGEYGGHFDTDTAEAVKRFQSERHIEHGGYLSYKTMETLETAPPAPVLAPPVTYAQGYSGQGYSAQSYSSGYSAYGYAQQAYAPGPCGPAPCQVPVPPVYNPCGPAPCQVPVPQPCGPAPCQGGYGQGGWGPSQHARSYSVQTQGRF